MFLERLVLEIAISTLALQGLSFDSVALFDLGEREKLQREYDLFVSTIQIVT